MKDSKAVAVVMFGSNGSVLMGKIQITKPHLNVEAKLARPPKSSQTSSCFGGGKAGHPDFMSIRRRKTPAPNNKASSSLFGMVTMK